ncbi:MAG: DUF3772 domain-containing protein [Caulobacteraceae bacterium]
MILGRFVRNGVAAGIGFLAGIIFLSGSAAAETPVPPLIGLASQSAIVDGAQAELKPLVQASLSPRTGEEALKARLAAVGPIRTSLARVVAVLTPKLTDVDARLAQLGPPPAAGQPAESAETATTRAGLLNFRQKVDTELREARLLMVEADQAGRSISDRLRGAIAARLWTRGRSILDPRLWRDCAWSLPGDVARVGELARDAGERLAAAGRRPATAAGGVAALVLALLLLGPVRVWLDRLGRRRAGAGPPRDRFRRTSLALWLVATAAVTPLLAGLVARTALIATGVATAPLLAIVDVAIRALVFAALIQGLGRALLSPGRPDWRVAPLSDSAARRLTPFPTLVGAAAGLATLVGGVNGVVGASLPTSLAADCVTVLVEILVIGLALANLGRARAERLGAAGAATHAPVAGSWMIVPVAAWATLAAALAALLTGYLAMAGFLTHEMIWVGTVLASLLLLGRFLDDLFPALLSPTAAFGRLTGAALGAPAQALEQFAVLLSGLARVALLLFGASTLLAPFGAGADDIVSRVTSANLVLHFGQVVISPGAILGALALFFAGLLVTREIRRWLEARYLPKTRMDLGVRASLASAVTYVGAGAAILMTMAFLGLSFSQIALFASALSVGIGFGLQSIVGNFVSGLILLAERPIKVGDWIAIGDLEGDVQRINIRATEIEMMDRSRLIVPNTDLVTKTVRNVTSGSAPARLRITLRTAIETDPVAARELILGVLRSNAEVLTQPPPSVYLSDVRDGTLEFTAFAYVASARLAYRIKSELLFAIVPEMKARGVALASSAPVVNIGLPDRPIEPSVSANEPPPAGEC